MVQTADEFALNLARSGLMTDEEIARFRQTLSPAKQTDSQFLALELVQAGKLTKYQAAAVFQGKFQALVLGKYVVLDKVGAGGMGQVFKALDRRMERLVALKLLPGSAFTSADSAGNPLVDPQKQAQAAEKIARLLREARTAARLQHTNIVTVYDVDEANGIYFLAMEYVAGRDLTAELKTRHPLPFTDAVGFVLQAARGLAYAHDQGVVHRDVKPSNLMLDERGTIKILDLGLARLVSKPGDEVDTDQGGPTHSGQVVGTVDFMSPEQADDTQQADHRSDIYSLGCTLYVLLTGRPPFTGETLIRKFLAHREQAIPSLLAARSDIPLALETVYQKMLAKRPEDRWQSMSDVIRELEACLLAPPPVAAVVPAPAPPSTPPIPPPPLPPALPAPPPVPVFIELEPVPEVVFRPVPESVPPRTTVPPPPPPLAGRRMQVAPPPPPGTAATAADIPVPPPIVNPLPPLPTRPPPVPARPSKPPSDAVPPPKRAAATRPSAPPTPRRAVSLKLEKSFTNSLGMRLTLIPAGEFLMGSPEDEKKRNPDEFQHRVRIVKPFYLGVYEVTQAEYEKAMGNNPSYFSPTGAGREKAKKLDTARFPVEQISWNHAMEFCKRVSAAEGKMYRLPTEGEWEYACRAGTTTVFHFGDTLSEAQANCICSFPYGVPDQGAYLGRTTEVGSFPPNAFGLFDMHGNVWEWCQHWYNENSHHDETLDDPPPSAFSGTTRAVRGGSFRLSAANCRAAFRNGFEPTSRERSIGFRVVCEPR